MVLVTGATGILGRVMVLELLKRGQMVRACRRKQSNIQEVKDSLRFYTENHDQYFNKIQWFDLDFSDQNSLGAALEGVTEVYHCAGKVSFDPKDKKQLYLDNIKFTRELLYACESSAVQVICHISSTSVLDGKNEKGEVDEDCNYNPKQAHSAYAVSKHFSEMEVWRASAEGLKTVILNPGIIIGSGNWAASSGTLFPQLLKNKFTFGGGSAYVDVRDVAKIALQLVDAECYGERFIIISENEKFLDIANKVRLKYGRSEAKEIPSFLLGLIRILHFLLGWLIPPLRMATKANISAVSTFTKVSNSKVTNTLNYTFISLEESLDFHLKNYKQDHPQL